MEALEDAMVEYMRPRGITIQALADQVGVSHDLIRKNIHLRTQPTLETLLLISQAIEYDYYNLVIAWIGNEVGLDVSERLRLGIGQT